MKCHTNAIECNNLKNKKYLWISYMTDNNVIPAWENKNIDQNYTYIKTGETYTIMAHVYSILCVFKFVIAQFKKAGSQRASRFCFIIVSCEKL